MEAVPSGRQSSIVRRTPQSSSEHQAAKGIMARRLGCSIYLPVVVRLATSRKRRSHRSSTRDTYEEARGLRRRRMIDNVEDKVLAGTGRDSCSISVASGRSSGGC